MKYTESHEWIELETGRVGISSYAQEELGEVVYVELPKVGQAVEAGEEVAVLESTKAASDIYAPVSGTIVSVNEKVVQDPSLLNSSPEDDGWLFCIEVSESIKLDSLLDPDAYHQLLSN